ncbi:MAG: SDR family NAD(P)-dependent oxidoreductase [Myxococcales bacterium]|nr:SDR family NAD(P)-dependent oxidoreductase [Myxococcales bacterium]
MATDLRGKTALVTGASSGIGAALARQLAARGANLIVVARREAELEALAAAIKAAHQVEVTVIALDLATPTAAAALFARTEDAGHPVDVLVNNAGFGEHQYFVEQAWGRVAQQLQLNIVTLTELSHRFGQAMAARGRGHILNVASIGAYTPAPTYATYSAGKAYVRDFTGGDRPRAGPARRAGVLPVPGRDRHRVPPGRGPDRPRLDEGVRVHERRSLRRDRPARAARLAPQRRRRRAQQDRHVDAAVRAAPHDRLDRRPVDGPAPAARQHLTRP